MDTASLVPFSKMLSSLTSEIQSINYDKTEINESRSLLSRDFCSRRNRLLDNELATKLREKSGDRRCYGSSEE